MSATVTRAAPLPAAASHNAATAPPARQVALQESVASETGCRRPACQGEGVRRTSLASAAVSAQLRPSLAAAIFLFYYAAEAWLGTPESNGNHSLTSYTLLPPPPS